MTDPASRRNLGAEPVPQYEWCVRQVVIDPDTDSKVTSFAAEGWTVHSTSTYWNPVASPSDAPTLVLVAWREKAAEPAAALTFEQRFESWNDEIEAWDQAVLVAV